MVEGRDSDLHEQLEWGIEEKGSLRKTCWAHFHAPKSCKWKLDLTIGGTQHKVYMVSKWLALVGKELPNYNISLEGHRGVRAPISFSVYI